VWYYLVSPPPPHLANTATQGKRLFLCVELDFPSSPLCIRLNLRDPGVRSPAYTWRYPTRTATGWCSQQLPLLPSYTARPCLALFKPVHKFITTAIPPSHPSVVLCGWLQSKSDLPTPSSQELPLAFPYHTSACRSFVLHIIFAPDTALHLHPIPPDEPDIAALVATKTVCETGFQLPFLDPEDTTKRRQGIQCRP
jgi:hypothetical protein